MKKRGKKKKNLEISNSVGDQSTRLWEYLSGFFACWVIAIGSKLNLFEAISDYRDGTSAEELAKRLGLDSHLVNIWCKAAYSFELLDLDEKGYFRFANSMDLLLINRPDTHAIAGTIENYVGASESFFHFYKAFKTGKTLGLEKLGQLYSESVEKATLKIPNYLMFSVLPNDPCLRNLINSKAKVLDFGCGTGLGMIQYAKVLHKWNFLGVDIDKILINKAKEKIKHNRLEDRIEVKVAYPGKLNANQDFDLILLTFTLHEVKNREEVLRELFKALKKSGNLLIVEVSSPNDITELRSLSGKMLMGAQISENLSGNTLISTAEIKELLKITNYRNIRAYGGHEGIFKVFIAQR